MIKDRGLIVKQIPYSDSSRIIKCFTQNHGIKTLFVRIPKKGSTKALLQIGSFIEFTASENTKGGMLSPKEIKWDSNIPNQQLNLLSQSSWVFTLELLHKSLVEGFALPQLHERIYNYYIFLLYQEIQSSPCVSLLNIAGSLGVIDLYGLSPLLPDHILKNLNKLAWNLNPNTSNPVKEIEVFNTELERFISHFGIQRIDSLELIEIDP